MAELVRRYRNAATRLLVRYISGRVKSGEKKKKRDTYGGVRAPSPLLTIPYGTEMFEPTFTFPPATESVSPSRTRFIRHALLSVAILAVYAVMLGARAGAEDWAGSKGCEGD